MGCAPGAVDRMAGLCLACRMETAILCIVASIAVLAVFGVALWLGNRLFRGPTPEESQRAFDAMTDEEKANEIAKNAF